MLVNGPYIRNTYSSDFVQGDNGFHSPKFCPKGELWLDMSMPEEEWPYVALHECHEAEDMSRGMDYEQAHDRAKRLENKFRRANRPGELRLSRVVSDFVWEPLSQSIVSLIETSFLRCCLETKVDLCLSSRFS